MNQHDTSANVMAGRDTKTYHITGAVLEAQVQAQLCFQKRPLHSTGRIKTPNGHMAKMGQINTIPTTAHVICSMQTGRSRGFKCLHPLNWELGARNLLLGRPQSPAYHKLGKFWCQAGTHKGWGGACLGTSTSCACEIKQEFLALQQEFPSSRCPSSRTVDKQGTFTLARGQAMGQ